MKNSEYVRPASTRQLVETIKASGEDFEFYPTTDSMIATIKKDMKENTFLDCPSLLDCGAGDGRVLQALGEGRKYAIEKSKPLLEAMDSSIFVVGTEFAEQTLIDKKVEVVFSSPPYSEYSRWATKIITEAHASYIYLVIPARWRDNDAIEQAIASREAKTAVIGSFDFLDAERAARAKVDIVRVQLCGGGRYGRSSQEVEPFSLWFAENFPIKIASTQPSKHALYTRSKEQLAESLSQSLVSGGSLISTLDQLYRRDLDKLVSSYQKISDIDPDLLGELGVELSAVQGALQQKIEGLKDLYWHELFNNLDKVTTRLTSASRKTLLGTLTEHTHVDFTVSNAFAIVIWVIKNSNLYFDDQLIRIVERMTEQANVELYKSNQHTFGNEQWRYCQTPDGLARYKLDYRIVLARVGGLAVSEWSFERGVNGLATSAAELLDDLCTIASNIGFDTLSGRSANFHWDTHVKNAFLFRDASHDEPVVLFEAKAFKNGNVHIKFNQDFICRLNVEFGRLKGWVKSPKEAAEELDIPLEQATKGFDSNLKLEDTSVLKLGFQVAA